MKFVVLACLAAVALASPQFRPIESRASPRFYSILSDNRDDRGDGNFNYGFETENGISTNVVGRPGSKGQSNMEGTFRFPLDDGTIMEVRFTADENGYRAESPLIPTPHPLPAHAIEQIRFAEAERARGGANRRFQ
ncbi:hypothetical protein Pcinc_036285 [Petrolisthes cinctipes]|uniref:Arthrodial cuticle protein AMP8.1 n=1 Tax=Petrolisthes cinctipes TaxID=88211 RepID=A0AAE1BUP6_PETCI|nr:hypothetical protein Pcinc_036285 [Petrolisthes cinctipes]